MSNCQRATVINFASGMDEIFKKMREVREARKMNQGDVAAKIGMESNNYSRIERGRAPNVSYKRIKEIAKALGVTVVQLLTYESPLTVLEEDAQSYPNPLAECKKNLDRVYRLNTDLTIENRELRKRIGPL